ncbi:hypothetical protein HNQ77_003820 [Silvibacterium bohemicum]|uniref:Uncharacterized protein n=1 Tax=Silvibacterium bohemicum TaxID=1577686 RepID=A0A841JXH4_9BACT|nr:hypothetical protein [Silvibacterium bohemicum]MBB6145850.1 hypothetical protein [Silvibacterium bohemicum]
MPDNTQVQSPLNLMLTIAEGQNQAILAYVFSQSQTINAGLDAVGTVHFARFLPEPGFASNPPTSQILWVLTEYDGSFDQYIKDFVQQMGPIFDKLLSYVVNPPPLPVETNLVAFGQWVNSNNQPSNLYSAYPACTVQMILNGGCPPA